jgi:hypothetical protein
MYAVLKTNEKKQVGELSRRNNDLTWSNQELMRMNRNNETYAELQDTKSMMQVRHLVFGSSEVSFSSGPRFNYLVSPCSRLLFPFLLLPLSGVPITHVAPSFSSVML